MERNAAELTVQKEEQRSTFGNFFFIYAAGGGHW